MEESVANESGNVRLRWIFTFVLPLRSRSNDAVIRVPCRRIHLPGYDTWFTRFPDHEPFHGKKVVESRYAFPLPFFGGIAARRLVVGTYRCIPPFSFQLRLS